MIGDAGQRGQDRERVRAPDDVEVVDASLLLAQPQPLGEEQEVEAPRSAFRAKCSNDENAIWLSARSSLQTVVLLTPGKWAARWT